MKRLRVGAALYWLLVVLLAPAVTSAEGRTREIIVVSPHWEGIKREFERAFQEKWRATTGDTISFRWLDIGGTSDIVRFLRSQSHGTKSGPGVDVMFGGGTDSFVELDRDGLLQPVALPERIAAEFPHNIGGVPLRSEQNTWHAAAISTFGIVYNRKALATLKLSPPKTWLDLTAPHFAGTIAAGDPRKSGSMHAMYEILLQGFGWERGWEVIRDLASNVGNFSGSASQVGKEIALGDALLGLAIDSYASELIRRYGDDSLGYAIPTDYPAVNGDGIAVLKNAPNPDLAEAFLTFTVSEEGQRLISRTKGSPGGPRQFDLGKLPVLPKLYDEGDLSSAVKESPFTWKSSLTYNAQLGAHRYTIVNDIFGGCIVDLHDQLVRLRKQRFDPSLARPYYTVPYAEVEEALRGNRWGIDPVFRSSTIERWSQNARKSFPASDSLAKLLRWLPSACLFLIIAVALRVKTRTRSRV